MTFPSGEQRGHTNGERGANADSARRVDADAELGLCVGREREKKSDERNSRSDDATHRSVYTATRG